MLLHFNLLKFLYQMPPLCVCVCVCVLGGGKGRWEGGGEVFTESVGIYKAAVVVSLVLMWIIEVDMEAGPVQLVLNAI